jgi:predicted esterase YcpF (UPF0227 family)
MTTVVYFHGFRSSPQSFKGQLIGQALMEQGPGNTYFAPQLPASPLEAVNFVEQWCEEQCAEGSLRNPERDLILVGSSLGGFYATVLAQRFGCRAVLLNPGTYPARDLATQVGVTTQFHAPDEPFEFKRSYLDELCCLHPIAITRPQRYFLVAATGDELLDWREMLARYQACPHKIVQGSDHGLSDFAEHLADVLAFCFPPTTTTS